MRQIESGRTFSLHWNPTDIFNPDYNYHIIYDEIKKEESKSLFYLRNQLVYTEHFLDDYFFHNENGPAIYTDSFELWMINGYFHRLDGPAIIDKKSKRWLRNGYFHRLDGPAIEWSNGDKEWWLNGLRHRENAPAIERNGCFHYFHHGLRHREDGPAIDGNAMNQWFYKGKDINCSSQEEFSRLIKLQGFW